MPDVELAAATSDAIDPGRGGLKMEPGAEVEGGWAAMSECTLLEGDNIGDAEAPFVENLRGVMIAAFKASFQAFRSDAHDALSRYLFATSLTSAMLLYPINHCLSLEICLGIQLQNDNHSTCPCRA